MTHSSNCRVQRYCIPVKFELKVIMNGVSCMCREWNSGPLKEQYMLLVTGPSLTHLLIFKQRRCITGPQRYVTLSSHSRVLSRRTAPIEAPYLHSNVLLHLHSHPVPLRNTLKDHLQVYIFTVAYSYVLVI